MKNKGKLEGITEGTKEQEKEAMGRKTEVWAGPKI